MACFNSLQTGRYMERLINHATRKRFEFCFNSLQTGRYMESLIAKHPNIPAKHLFQFPSNGKVHGKSYEVMEEVEEELVSIPFKREGTWKAPCNSPTKHCLPCFNSLQTGRYMERMWWKKVKMLSRFVSIPFKREGTWKALLTGEVMCGVYPLRFNSLQTGRYMES